MTKMDMIWVGVASMTYPETSSDKFMRKDEVERTIGELFHTTITPVMLTKHLVSSEGRQADRDYPERGGSRNRYLVKSSAGNFRLYKNHDSSNDGWDKTGPTHPDPTKLDDKFRYLVEWYENEYSNS